MHTFEIRIQKRADNAWPVVVEESEAGVFLAVRTEGTLGLDVQELSVADPSAYGLVLGKALFRGAVDLAFAKALAHTKDDLHVLLTVEDDGLRTLRWERLWGPTAEGWHALALDQRVPFSRYLPSITDRRFPPIGRADLRLLIVAASPDGLGAFRLARFDESLAVDAVKSALGGRIPTDVLANVPGAVGPPTLDALCERITAGSYTLLHLVCHGAFVTRESKTSAGPMGETVLYLCGATGGVAPVTASELIRRLGLLRGARGLPHLAFLSTCESAAPEAEWALGGLGQRLVRELGLPAVVAMTDRITVDTAHALATAFYRRLCEHGQVDRALTEAYAGLVTRPDIRVPVPALVGRLGGRPLFSSTREHALTPAEVARALDRMAELFSVRAPVVLPESTSRAATVRGLLGTDAADLVRQARQEREEGLAAINGLCGEVLEMSFEALADGHEPPPYNAECPFRGLYPFRPEHRRFFFGRGLLVDDLKARLDRHPFLAVLGDSGSGKSSLVLAGLLPRLVGDRAARLYQVITPGSRPDEALTAALDALGETSDERPALLVIDQLEEVFTLCGDAARRRTFFDRLLVPAPGRAVVLTMRADFWGDCFPYKELAEAIHDNQVRVVPMDAAELRRAMEEQAKVVNLRFEAGLAYTLLDDVAGELAAMPLLQHALLELWNRRRGRWLKVDAYSEIGGVRGAIARTADSLYNEMTSDLQQRVREIFVRLSRLGDEVPDSTVARRDTRRGVTVDDLIPDGGDPAATRALIARLADRRLVVVDQDDRVEVGHEALVSHWPRLRGWLDENPGLLRQRDEISEAARDWEQSDNSNDRLVHHGARLVQAEALLVGVLVDLNDAERRYVGACGAHREAQRNEREMRQRRDLFRLRIGLAAAMALVIVVASVGCIAWYGWDTVQKENRINTVLTKKWQDEAKRANRETQTAREKAEIAESRRIAALSTSERNTRLDRSLLLAVEALRSADTLEARESLHKALESRPGLTSFLHLEEGLVTSVAFSPVGETIAAGYSVSGDVVVGVVLWDAATRRRLTDGLLPVREGDVLSVAFSHDGKAIAAGYGGRGKGGVVLWDVATRQRLTDRPLPVDTVGEGNVWSLAFSPDGKAIAAGCGHGVVLWDAATRQRLTDRPLPVREGDVMSVAFSHDGKAIVAGYSVSGAHAGGVVLWDAATRQRLPDGLLRVREGYVENVAFSPDGKAIAAGYMDIVGDGGGVVLWDAATRQRLPDGLLPVTEGYVESVAFSPDGKAIAAGFSLSGVGVGGGVVLWDAATRQRLPDGLLPVTEGNVKRVAFSPDSKAVAAAYLVSDVGVGSGVVLWDAATRQRLSDRPLLVREGVVHSVAFSPDGKAIAAGYTDGVVLWDAATRQRLPDGLLPVRDGFVGSVAFSPDGKAIAAGYCFSHLVGGVVLWDAATRQRLPDGRLRVREGCVGSVAFSPDGKAIAAGYTVSGVGRAGGVVLWDAATRQRLSDRPFPVGKGGVASGAFSHDGKAIAAGYYQGSSVVVGVVLWDAATRQRLPDGLLPVTEGGVVSVAFGPDGKAIAAGYRAPGAGIVDGVVLWDAATRQRLPGGLLPVRQGLVGSVAFSPDGKAIAAGYGYQSGGGVVLLDLDLESWQRRAGQIANRNFTRKEWRAYFPETPYHATFPDLPVRPEAVGSHDAVVDPVPGGVKKKISDVL